MQLRWTVRYTKRVDRQPKISRRHFRTRRQALDYADSQGWLIRQPIRIRALGGARTVGQTHNLTARLRQPRKRIAPLMLF